MKITLGIWKKATPLYNKRKTNKKDIVFSYETERFIVKKFKKRLTNVKHLVKKKLNNVKDREIIYIGIDLLYEGELRLVGCAISGATLNATRISIIEMLISQLIRQIKDTLKAFRNKRWRKTRK